MPRADGLLRGLLLALALLAASGCTALSQSRRAEVEALVTDSRAQALTCTAADACATPSALYDLGPRMQAASTEQVPRHAVLLLDHGSDALLARLNLIHAARRSIDLQTYIFDRDDSAQLVLEALLDAARRGVRVRLLVDQLSAFKDPAVLAALATAHRNFEVRVYNPVFDRSSTGPVQYVLATLLQFRRLNQRMHTKLLLVDDAVGIVGGRNYQDDYYDWDPVFVFRDRDVLVAGPVAKDMAASFRQFWQAPLAVPAEQLRDVAARLLDEGAPPLVLPPLRVPARAEHMRAEALDPDEAERLATAALPVGPVEYDADLPQKHRSDPALAADGAIATEKLRGLINGAEREVILQTPYLVLSPAAQDLFRELHARPAPPRVEVSTNSLAAADTLLTYAITYKYKRRYLRKFGFEIFEYKPFPEDAPIDFAAAGEGSAPGSQAPVPSVGAAMPAWRGVERTRPPPTAAIGHVDDDADSEYAAHRAFGSSGSEGARPVPLTRAGIRAGLHAKSLVVDEQVGVVGSHNFDPRGDHYNTENAVVVYDPAFAHLLADSIRRDMAPANAWTIAPREKSPVLPGVEYSIAKLAEHMPVFDFWPVRYSTSYAFRPGPDCPAPLPMTDPRFHECYVAVGDFPEVALSVKALLTRIFTAFGAGLAPIL